MLTWQVLNSEEIVCCLENDLCYLVDVLNHDRSFYISHHNDILVAPVLLDDSLDTLAHPARNGPDIVCHPIVARMAVGVVAHSALSIARCEKKPLAGMHCDLLDIGL